MLNVDKPTWGHEQFAVCGGRFSAERLGQFLEAWSWPEAEHRWAIWEYVSGLTMTTGDLPESTHWANLERAELFGPSGQLSVRRDELQIRWHFVGEPAPKIVIPTGYNNLSYWEAHPEDLFRREPRSMLLWGQHVAHQPGHWHDDRVAWAELAYPGVVGQLADDGGRIEAHYHEFTYAGQVAFVWLTGIAAHVSKEA